MWVVEWQAEVLASLVLSGRPASRDESNSELALDLNVLAHSLGGRTPTERRWARVS